MYDKKELVSISTLISSIRSYFYPSFDWIPSTSISSETFSNILSAKELLSISNRFSGKLLLREEIQIEQALWVELTETGMLQAVEAIESHVWGWRCRRCGNKLRRKFAEIPCARCNQTHVYCRNCVEMGMVLQCQPLYVWTGPPPKWPVQEKACRWDGELTLAQKKASDRIREVMERGTGELLTWAVCGAGKTEMLFAGIGSALEAGKRVCLASPRADVVRELLPRFRQAFPDTAITGLYGGSEEKAADGQLVVATTHQLLRFARAFDVKVIDEIDAFPYHKDPSLPFAVARAAKSASARIYLTATPRKEQRRRLGYGRLDAVFVPIRFHGCPLPVPRLILSSHLKRSLQNNMPPAAFFDWLKRRQHPERQLMIFVPYVELAGKMEKAIGLLLREELGDSAIASVHAADKDREAKVQQFRNRELQVLITTTILERGVTFPSVDVAVLDAGHAVFDEAALVQIAGRAGRSPDDPDGEVLFFHAGKTKAMVAAVRSINAMNKRAVKI
ncbi:DNA/RNA helicase [Sediminibacillus dalangtanensis]|uniref:DNA/RNA helicase n=1 Tax=Sediminibacillus dalangtanensis TaxID=2729421 RepID=A0ABX7VTW1_9BACI|nr:helicase-related protein [Sediminibacillus dalangtanensis]QTN00400.1 DNA/RNA helicase [Sediminibacillus dalangtanensis]